MHIHQYHQYISSFSTHVPFLQNLLLIDTTPPPHLLPIMHTLCFVVGTDGERNDVKEVVLSILGADRIHLCLTDDLYSMRDLLSVQRYLTTTHPVHHTTNAHTI